MSGGDKFIIAPPLLINFITYENFIIFILLMLNYLLNKPTNSKISTLTLILL